MSYTSEEAEWANGSDSISLRVCKWIDCQNHCTASSWSCSRFLNIRFQCCAVLSSDEYSGPLYVCVVLNTAWQCDVELCRDHKLVTVGFIAKAFRKYEKSNAGGTIIVPTFLPLPK